MKTETNLYEIAIGFIPGIGNYLTRQLISYCGSPEAVFKTKKQKLMNIPGIGETLADQILKKEVLQEAEKELKKVEKEGAQVLFFTHPAYPQQLKAIGETPSMLYFKGEMDLNAQRTIAIVGTRKATEYGRQVTEDMVSQLKGLNVSIISGLAYGIDIIAHKAALKHNIPTLGVMGSGLDVIYPASHKSAVSQMVKNGGIMTENKMGTAPDAGRFPARNRIVAAISDVTIIVESAERGGALITAEYANSFNKEVFAVPGNLNFPYSAGCNDLIKKHKAHIYTKISDLIELMNWDLHEEKKVVKTKKAALPPELSTEELEITNCFKDTLELHIDELSWKSGYPVNKIASLLLNMEFMGLIKPLPGKRFKFLVEI